jgi:hypothetical protein
MLVLHQDAGDHKGPLPIRSAALARTGHWNDTMVVSRGEK